MCGNAIFSPHSSCVPLLVSRSSRRPVPRQNTAGVPLLVSRAPGFSPPCHNASFTPILVFRAPSFCGLLITLSAHRTLPPAASASSTPRVSRPRKVTCSVTRKHAPCHHTGLVCQEAGHSHHTQHRFVQKLIAAGGFSTSETAQHKQQRLMRSNASEHAVATSALPAAAMRPNTAFSRPPCLGDFPPRRVPTDISVHTALLGGRRLMHAVSPRNTVQSFKPPHLHCLLDSAIMSPGRWKHHE
jgi:hypothetical protein